MRSNPLNKIFENLLLNEMATSRSKAIKQLEGDSYIFMKHIMKIYFHQNITGDLNGWLKELATWCEDAASIRLKPNNKCPNRDFYLNHLLDKIETERDVRVYSSAISPLIDSDDIYKKYKDFINKWNKLREVLSDMMASKSDFDRIDYQDKIKRGLGIK